MGALAQARGVAFYVRTLVPLRWSDGTVKVPAGAVGAAVLRWRGERPGWFVEFDGHAMVGLLASTEGLVWQRSLLAGSQRVN